MERMTYVAEAAMESGSMLPCSAKQAVLDLESSPEADGGKNGTGNDDKEDDIHQKKKSWVGGERCPEWLAKHFEIAVDDVSCVEVAEGTKIAPELLYDIITDYCYHHAVDMDQPASSEPDLEKLNEVKKEKSFEDQPEPTVPNTRQNKLMQVMADLGENVEVGYTDEMEMEMSKKEKAAIERQSRLNTREGDGRLSALSASLQVSNPRRLHCAPGNEKGDPQAPKFSFGLGFSHTLHKGNKIVIANVLRRVSYPKVLLVFGTSPENVKNFLLFVKKWHFKRYEQSDVQFAGKYYLWVLDISPSGRASWRNTGQRTSRPLSSIVLRDGQLDAIQEDFKEFKSAGTRKWYVEHGIPHRRSYLFYGPPGTGKTSTIRALAGQLRTSACFLSLSDNHFQNKTLHDAIMKIPRPSMLILEDIDVLFNGDRKSLSNSFVTFSGLLNALDGMLSTSEICIIMTTNHPERLDPALTRAGRVDRRFEFKLPDKTQMKHYFLSFYPDADEKLAKKFADLVFARPEKEARSIATLQGHFIHTRGLSAEESVEKIDHFFEAFYPHSKGEHKLTYTL